MLASLPALLDSLAPYGPLVVGVMGLAAAVESAFGLGVVMPGETVVAAGAAVLHDPVTLVVAWAVVTLGAFVGDQVGYVIGRRLGPGLADGPIVRRLGRGHWDRAVDLVQRRSFPVIVVARLLPGVRTIVSAAAGVTGVRWRRFAVADAAASGLWSAVWVLGGAALGELLLGPGAWAVVGAGLTILVAVRVARVLRTRRASRAVAT